MLCTILDQTIVDSAVSLQSCLNKLTVNSADSEDLIQDGLGCVSKIEVEVFFKYFKCECITTCTNSCESKSNHLVGFQATQFGANTQLHPFSLSLENSSSFSTIFNVSFRFCIQFRTVLK